MAGKTAGFYSGKYCGELERRNIKNTLMIIH